MFMEIKAAAERAALQRQAYFSTQGKVLTDNG
jgi:hypothetical protein